MAKKTEFSIETVKKYIFWACVPIGLLFPVITTVSAVGSITKAFNDRKSTLESTKKATEAISSDREHPNENTIISIQNCEKELRGRVVKAWTTLEEDQRKRNLWPEEVGEFFREEVAKLKFNDEMSVRAREFYLNFVEKYLPALEVYVDRRRVQKKDENGDWIEMEVTQTVSSTTASGSSSYGGGSDMGSGGMGNMGMSAMDAFGTTETPLPRGLDGEEIYRYVGTVDWPNPETRTVTSFWQKLPKANEVWFAQEELWVYHALLSVVKESNLDATGPHNAVIKRIENLLIGQAASAALQARSASRINQPAGSGSGMGMDSGSMSMSSSDSGSSGGMDGGMLGGQKIARNEADVITIKKHNRYVDDKAKPLAATEESPFSQFKRMPICLRLIVDQRKIPEILVNCANCSMPIDVLWVRFNPAAVKPFDLGAYDASVKAGAVGSDAGSSSSSSSGGMGDTSGGSYGSGSSGGGGESGGSSANDVQIRIDGIGGVYGTNAIPIEIYGCINIFNPVEHGGLQIDESKNSAPASATNEQPAAEQQPAPPAENNP